MGFYFYKSLVSTGFPFLFLSKNNISVLLFRRVAYWNSEGTAKQYRNRRSASFWTFEHPLGTNTQTILNSSLNFGRLVCSFLSLSFLRSAITGRLSAGNYLRARKYLVGVSNTVDARDLVKEATTTRHKTNSAKGSSYRNSHQFSS